ncbi:hypothetical protein EDB81DRAFT_755816 [Dactylonectria macrodidyma]|uniref:Ribosomal RNA methyltransferase FtsJ domain-containing protein n=1 Tax=Dactylonectria macrodidyma TaxID=307937 RepID=A0A9P9JC95_9HYPO|nr:hypothetical protein EDB81DRAFT_755816 [Dactylonectria macrodidyma]
MSSDAGQEFSRTDGDETQHEDNQQDEDFEFQKELADNYTIINFVEFRRLGDKSLWQRKEADDPEILYQRMRYVAQNLHRVTKAFDFSKIPNQPAILDTCFAPGGFVTFFLKEYPGARVKAMTLPIEQGGHRVLLSHDNLDIEYLDVTMLAGDMGVTEDDVPDSYPDKDALIFHKTLSAEDKFDLALCDGQVLRTQSPSEWEEFSGVSPLATSQFALSLEHLKPGGTMVILLHRLEAWRTVKLLHTLRKFSLVQLYKYPYWSAVESSFYGVAKNVQSDGLLAAKAIADWKDDWKTFNLLTLGANANPNKEFPADNEDAQAVLKDFGEELVQIGKIIWETQEEALHRAAEKAGQK